MPTPSDFSDSPLNLAERLRLRKEEPDTTGLENTFPFAPETDPGDELDTSVSLLTGKTITASFLTEAAYQPANPTRVNDGVAQIGMGVTHSDIPSGVDPDGSGLWKVDLGSPQLVAGFGIQVIACSEHIFLDWSDDGSSYTNVAESNGDESGFGEKGYIHVYEFAAVTHRYWRLRYTHTGGGFHCGAQVTEWELYGTDAEVSAPEEGQWTQWEQSYGNATNDVGPTNYAYVPGSMLLFANGIQIVPSEVDPDAGTFTLPRAYAADVVLQWRYQVADPDVLASHPAADSIDQVLPSDISGHRWELVTSGEDLVWTDDALVYVEVPS